LGLALGIHTLMVMPDTSFSELRNSHSQYHSASAQLSSEQIEFGLPLKKRKPVLSGNEQFELNEIIEGS
jgi:hypothetical protein